MTTIELAQQYQRIFRRRFPAVTVAPDPDIQFADEPVLGVFGLPDGPKLAYTRFVVEELPAILETHGLPRVTLLPHGVSTTRQFYGGLLSKSRTVRRCRRGKAGPPPARTGAQHATLDVRQGR